MALEWYWRVDVLDVLLGVADVGGELRGFPGSFWDDGVVVCGFVVVLGRPGVDSAVSVVRLGHEWGVDDVGRDAPCLGIIDTSLH